MADLKEPRSHPVNDLSDSDTERHPAEALIIRKAEQASSSAAAQTPVAREPGEAAEQQEHKSAKQPAVLIAANPALAKARDPGKASGKAKRKKRQRDSRAVEPDPGAHRRENQKPEAYEAELAELASSDSEEKGIALGNAPGARGKKQRIVDPIGVTVVEEDEEPVGHAPEMQRLLRQPRYFDEDFENSSMRCFRCGGSGHMSYSCPNAEKLRPCYLCGQFGHSRGQCPNMLCFKCNQPGHLARDCPAGQVSAQLLAPVCLRCGRPDCPAAQAGDYVRAEGGCTYDYADEDMAQVRCMLCGRRGHFCCQSTAQLPPLQASCYNCGDGGHTGIECWRDRPNGVVNERRNTAAARGTIVQRSVPALGMDHHYYQGSTAGDAGPLKHGGFGPQYGGTSYQERVSRMQSRTGEAMRTPYTQANTHVRFDANGDGTEVAGGNRNSRRRYGRR